MVNQSLVALTNSVLGTGKSTARGNKAYRCPYCNHHKPKLEVNLTENKQGFHPWHCWACDKKGKTVLSLFNQSNTHPDLISELKTIVKYDSGNANEKSAEKLKLPEDFVSLKSVSKSDIIGRHALA